MDYFKHRDKMRAVAAAEQAGVVADNMDVRMQILANIKSGSITLAQGQAQLKQIKRNASKIGKTTRSKVYRHA